MASPALTSYSAGAGLPIHGGRWPGGRLSGDVALDAVLPVGSLGSASSSLSGSVAIDGLAVGGAFDGPLYPAFASITDLGSDSFIPTSTPGQRVLLDAHASGGGTTSQTFGHKRKATLAAGYGYDQDTEFYWTAATISGNLVLRPSDSVWRNGARTMETYWHGYTHANPGGGADYFRPYTWAKLDSLISWFRATYPQAHPTQWDWQGTSMGAWGGAQFAVRRPDVFAAVYCSMPRVRYANNTASTAARFVRVPQYVPGGGGGTLAVDYTPVTAPSSVPLIDPAFGAGNVAQQLDTVAYATSSSNAMPWFSWAVGWADPYTNRQDHVDMVAAMRATGRGFAFAWHAGGHDSTAQLAAIQASYPLGTFDRARGYPVFSEHSLDADPATADSGGINVGLSFRSVVESAGAWSCEVTHISSACTVKVKPKSPVYTGNPAPQLVTIPAANTWVSVSF